MLCFVVVAEEIDARVRGWATGTLGPWERLGAGLAAVVFAAVNLLPYGWRALYVIGGGSLLFLPITAAGSRKPHASNCIASKSMRCNPRRWHSSPCCTI